MNDSHTALTTARHYRWADLPAEPLKGTISRKLVSGERMMIAHVYLKQGDDVPRHSHENEQITYILSGALRFWLGDREAERRSRSAQERCWSFRHICLIAPFALEDTLDVDVFCPPRQDWLDGTDAYLRR